MIIRRYTCKDMQEALLKVKMDLGSEAVIMNSRKVKPKGLRGLFSKPMIEVVAAVDEEHLRSPNTPKKHKDIQNVVKTLAAVRGLSQNNVSRTINAPAQTETSKIAELENKVQSMENTLKKIYQTLQGKPEKSAISADQNAGGGISQSRAQDQWEPLNNVIVRQGNLSRNNLAHQVHTNTVNEVEQSSLDNELSMVKKILFNQDLEPVLIEKILDKIRKIRVKSSEDIHDLAFRILTVLLGKPEPLSLKEKRPHVAIFIGPTGVGKTTTLAKIAAEFSLNQQKSVGLITADTYRIAAIDQLKTYAEILNIPLSVVYSPEEINDAVNQLEDKDLILIDTAGRSHKNKPHFDELKDLISLANADEIFLLLSCNTGPRAIKETLEYYAFIKDFKLIFTKLDEAPSLGVIFNARYLTGKPLSYITTGQSVPDDIEFVNPKQLSENVLNITKSYL